MNLVATPLDRFVGQAAEWVNSTWYVWVTVTGVLFVVVAIVVISKVRTRARLREPQYRRQLPN
jgi:threonine/homoserine/homoserine lactone efflux protein